MRRRLSQAGAAAILLLLVLAGGLLILSPAWQAIAETEDEVAHLATQVSRLRAIAERKPIAERHLDELRQGIAAEKLFWTGASPAAISANIQNSVRHAITSSGGHVRSASDAGESEERDLRKLTIRISAEGPLVSLRQVLQAIAEAKPMLFTDTLSVTASGSEGQRDRPPQMTYELAITGYVGIARR